MIVVLDLQSSRTPRATVVAADDSPVWPTKRALPGQRIGALVRSLMDEIGASMDRIVDVRVLAPADAAELEREVGGPVTIVEPAEIVRGATAYGVGRDLMVELSRLEQQCASAGDHVTAEAAARLLWEMAQVVRLRRPPDRPDLLPSVRDFLRRHRTSG